jgi:zinc/manganese transport system substrate-binding protein
VQCLTLWLTVGYAGSTWAGLKVVATLPDFGAIAQEIGGEKVDVTTLAKGTEDAHFVDARPSFLKDLNKADLLLEGGAELEVGWLPPLINNARNRKILTDGTGHIILSHGLKLLDVPQGQVDRSKGDVHLLGNPHYWLDPENGRQIARHIFDALSAADKSNAAYYEGNLKKFEKRVDAKLLEWKKALEPFRGTKVVSYHRSYDYFLEKFGFELVGTIEPKPGIEPSPTYVNGLIPKLKSEGVKLVFIEPFRPRRTPEYIANAIGARLLVLPDKVGAHEKAKDYVQLFDVLVEQVTSALNDQK